MVVDIAMKSLWTRERIVYRDRFSLAQEANMTAFVPKFEYLGNCKPGQLVRLKEGDETRWAITCSIEGRFVAPVLIMSETEVKTVNIMEGGPITGDFGGI